MTTRLAERGRRRTGRAIVASLLLVLWSTGTTSAQPFASYFDSGNEDWEIQNVDSQTWVLGGNYTPEHESEGGSVTPGYIWTNDTGSDSFFFQAPEQWVNAGANLLNSRLQFDRYVKGTGTPVDYFDVLLVGQNGTIGIDTPRPDTTWTRDSVVIGECADWRFSDGSPASLADITTILSELTHILIRGEHIAGGTERAGLDAVVMTQPLPVHCGFQPDPLDFGPVAIGSQRTLSLALHNLDCDPISGVLRLDDPFDRFGFAGDTTYSLQPGEAQDFQFYFEPDQTFGAFASVEAIDDAWGATCQVFLDGSGSLPDVRINEHVVAFEDVEVGLNDEKTFSVTNQGPGWTTGSASVSCPEFSVVGDPSFALGAGESHVYPVRFSPTAEESPVGDLLVQVPNATTGTIPVVGTGIPAVTAVPLELPHAASLRLEVLPNPSAGTAVIRFAPGGPGVTSLSVYDVVGRRVRTLHEGQLAPGVKSVTWDTRDAGGRSVAAGHYFLRLSTPQGVLVRRIVVRR